MPRTRVSRGNREAEPERKRVDALVKSVTRSCLAMSLLAMQEFIRPGRVNPRQETHPTHARPQTAPENSCFVSTNLVRGAVPRIGELVLQGVVPREILRVSLTFLLQLADVTKFLVARKRGELSWQEFENKVHAFYCFAYVDSILNLPNDSDVPITELSRLVSGLEHYSALWVTEGLGRRCADFSWRFGSYPQNLLTDSTDSDGTHCKTAMLCALHAGMGLSFAENVLGLLNSDSGPAEISTMLRAFFRLCQDNSDPAYLGAAYESLGMVCRSLYPNLINEIDHQLTDPETSSYFWHGVGRAIYFAPTRFLPIARGFADSVEMSQTEPFHATGRANALAGLAFALTLVNIKHPEVVDDIVCRYGRKVVAQDGFSNGVGSAAAIWYEFTGCASAPPLCSFDPHSPNPVVSALWDRYVRQPCQYAIDRYYPALKRANRLGELFHYATLEERVEQLQEMPSAAERVR